MKENRQSKKDRNAQREKEREKEREIFEKKVVESNAELV